MSQTAHANICIFLVALFRFMLFCVIHTVLEEFHRKKSCSTTSSPRRVASVLPESPLCFLCVLVRSTEV